jgi:ABC-type branched-subunit amino acid transport system substrate-binding protein
VEIGVVLPLQGARAVHGKLLLQAAQMAVDEENANASATGSPRFALAVRNESEQWGQASNAIVQLIIQDQVLAIITSCDGRIAHQAEQIANKTGGAGPDIVERPDHDADQYSVDFFVWGRVTRSRPAPS